MSKKHLAEATQALEQGRHKEALAMLAAYAEGGEINLRYYMVKGLSELGLSDWQNAADTFGEAVRRFHSNHELWAYRGLALQQLPNSTAETIASFEKSMKLNPSNGVASGNLANLYRRFGRFEEAEHMARLGAVFHPDRAWGLNILGLVLGERGKFMEAQKTYEQALKDEPTNQHVLYNLAYNQISQQKFDEAWPLFERAQKASPHEAHLKYGAGLARILAGDYENGWPIYEARIHSSNPGCVHAPMKGPRLQPGDDVDGKTVALIHEQGFGDNLHFCRFGQLLADKGAELIWVVEPPLKRLFENSFPGKVYTVKDDYPEPDYHLPMLSLPLVTGHITPDTWPKPPYFKAGMEPVLPSTGKGPRIGVIWAGSPGHEKNYHRSMPLKALGPLFSTFNNAQFYAPFTGDIVNEITDEPITRLDPLLADFASTAALMKQMDYIITVDTSGAHLAGGLNVRTFLLINYVPEWRWGFGGDRTPWYPNMTIIRQKNPGDWDSVTEQLIPLLLKNTR